MSKAIQVYDDAKEKVVDIPEDEVENITDMMRVFTGIQEVWYLAYKEKISEPNFISGLLRFAISFVKRGLDQTMQVRSQEEDMEALLVQKLKRFGNP